MRRGTLHKVLTIVLLSMIASAMLSAAGGALAETNAGQSSSVVSKATTILNAADVVLTETNEPLSTGGEISSNDVDNPPTFVAQRNVAGTYGTFNINSINFK